MVLDRQTTEINVKSVLNAVKGMPFRWSINPYRGCSHACPFCVSGDTKILMADGTTRLISAIVAGDEIIGTVREGHYRRYTATTVHASWTVDKSGFRITLADGTEIIASGDHRFLSERGWKFVTGAEHGPERRPHLTLNNRLLGTGSFADGPTKSVAYERGYLCGIIRGDGTPGCHEYRRVAGQRGKSWQFRLALTDADALSRAREFLAHFSVPAVIFRFQQATVNWRTADAIRASARCHIETIQRIVEWPSEQTDEWCKGFLAGIFDAEGGWNDGSLRIGNTNTALIDCTVRCLTRFGFSIALERRRILTHKPIIDIRLVGGLREHLRFFHTVGTAIGRKRSIHGKALKNASSQVVAIEPIGTRQLFDITTGTGDFIANGIVSHNCYARRTHWFLDEDGVADWSTKVFVKINAPEILRRELARPKWKREEVALGTATDPYQAIESRYKISRGILEALRDYSTPASIVTRSPMITRDLDVLTQLARGAGVTVCVSIATIDDRIAREIEPTVALPSHRLLAVRRLAEAGIRAGIILAPILPGITDDRAGLEAVVRAAREHGAHFVHHNVLHLGDVTRDAFFQFLDRRHPALIPRYLRMYRGKYAPNPYRTGVGEIVESAKEEHGIQGRRYVAPVTAPAPEPAQLSLFAGA